MIVESSPTLEKKSMLADSALTISIASLIRNFLLNKIKSIVDKEVKRKPKPKPGEQAMSFTESIISAIQDELDGFDFESKMTEKIDEAMEGYDVEKKIQEAIENFDVEKHTQEAIENTLSDYQFEREIDKAIEDSDLETKIQEEIDGFDFESTIKEKIEEAIEDVDFKELIEKKIAEHLKDLLGKVKIVFTQPVAQIAFTEEPLKQEIVQPDEQRWPSLDDNF